MAALQLNHHLHRMRSRSSFSSNKAFRQINDPHNHRARIIPFANCQKHDHGGADSEPEKAKLQGGGSKREDSAATATGLLGGVMKLGRGLKETLSPKKKGDWNDVVLMSLSFAVYIYMSQKIVCAYCAWISMLH